MRFRVSRAPACQLVDSTRFKGLPCRSSLPCDPRCGKYQPTPLIQTLRRRIWNCTGIIRQPLPIPVRQWSNHSGKGVPAEPTTQSRAIRIRNLEAIISPDTRRGYSWRRFGIFSRQGQNGQPWIRTWNSQPGIRDGKLATQRFLSSRYTCGMAG